MSSIIETVTSINEYIARQFHLEMCLHEYKNYSLTIVGSDDLIYYHNLEIKFNDVDVICGKIDWLINTKVASFGMLSDEKLYEFNLKHYVLKDYNVFYFRDEDGLYTYIAAKYISMQINTVKYNA